MLYKYQSLNGNSLLQTAPIYLLILCQDGPKYFTVCRAGCDQFGALGKSLAGAPCITTTSTTKVHTLTQTLHSFVSQRFSLF